MDTTQWTSFDGKNLPYTRWPDAVKPAQPKAVLICVHGLSGAASDFWPAGEMLEKDGWAVYGMQLRGQGNDPDLKKRGDIRNSAQWTSDLRAFNQAVRKKHPNVPIFWVGESLGTLILSHTVATLSPEDEKPAGVVLFSPVIDFRIELPWWKYWGLRLVMAVMPWKRISLESLGDSEVKVTNTTTHKSRMEKTPHYVEFFTLRLFRAVDKMVRSSQKAAAALQMPTLVFYTPNDVFTSKEQVERFFDAIASPDKTKVFFPESYHLILHDKDRAEALRELRKWLSQKLE